ncbi:MAG: DUF1922 domain-containing protein [Candidatus Nezhaarchaeota archaeon]|nr:DUF1922 domain-containing protein [Candidatus Nezhaarchaeota archaeon]
MPKPKFIVYRCPSCRSAQASSLRYSSRRCPYCGRRVKLKEVEALAYALTAVEAAASVARVKEVDAASARA